MRKHHVDLLDGSLNGPKIEQKSILSAFCVEVVFRHPFGTLPEPSRRHLEGNLQQKCKTLVPKLDPNFGCNMSMFRSFFDPSSK